ncbi:MAG: hypothetical protein AAGF67_01100 [Verrucomicrobiota bacterium]
MEEEFLAVMEKTIASPLNPEPTPLRNLVCTGRTVAILTCAVVGLIKLSSMGG